MYSIFTEKYPLPEKTQPTDEPPMAVNKQKVRGLGLKMARLACFGTLICDVHLD
ncbi:hypothetical protein BofuT4_uP056060.1 [Botrytis cinerea T4]|uniref:Uncharacterized protein n=1 Tax=Botryotinia fuckeliana (strain T4) TaxID=999810 RepID=G2XW35_BOTF4|nr:hypothetical protein BofuT4_uP056060.1 [Botrytis cinerea T4]